MSSKAEKVGAFISKYFIPLQNSRRNAYLFTCTTRDTSMADSLKKLGHDFLAKGWDLNMMIRCMYKDGDVFFVAYFLNGTNERLKRFNFSKMAILDMLSCKDSTHSVQFDLFGLRNTAKGSVSTAYKAAMTLLVMKRATNGELKPEKLFKYLVQLPYRSGTIRPAVSRNRIVRNGGGGDDDAGDNTTVSRSERVANGDKITDLTNRLLILERSVASLTSIVEELTNLLRRSQ